MDKYELNTKVDKIKKHFSKQNYAQAVKIADGMDFASVKDWKTLALMINLYDAINRNEDVRYFCVLAYNRNLGGKKIIYKLSKVDIRLGRLDEAEELYEEYADAVGTDSLMYELKYDLRVAQGADNEELIEILERQAELDFDDKYGYLLAQLYARNDNPDKCIEICDRLIEAYGVEEDNEYAQKAKELKSYFIGEGYVAEGTKKLDEENKAATKVFTGLNDKRQKLEQDKEKQEVLEAFGMKHDTAEPQDTNVEARKNVELNKEIKDQTVKNQENSVQNTTVTEPANNVKTNINLDNTNLDKTNLDNEEQVKYYRPMRNMNLDNQDDIEPIENIEGNEEVVNTSQVVPSNVVVNDSNINEVVQNASNNLEDLVANARKSVDSGFEEIKKASELEQISVAVPQGSEKFDTRSLQNNILDGIGGLYDQIVNEENVFKVNEELKDTKDLSKGKELVEISSAPSEKTTVKTNEVKTSEVKQETVITDTTSSDTTSKEVVSQATVAQNTVTEDVTTTQNAGQDNVATAGTDTSVNDDNTQMDSDVKEALDMVALAMENEKQSEAKNSAAAKKSEETVAKRKPVVKDDEEKKNRVIPAKIKNYFSKYTKVEGLVDNLCETVMDVVEEYGSKDGTSSYGNVIIYGNKSSDKKTLAFTLVRAIVDYGSANRIYPVRRIANSSGDVINHKGILKSREKIADSMLVIENAGELTADRAVELFDLMTGYTSEALVVIEDSENGIKELFNKCPELEELFTHRIEYKQYTVNELVSMCKNYAKTTGFCIDDRAILMLYSKVDELYHADEVIDLGILKDIIDEATSNAENRASKIFGGIRKKRIDGEEYLVLTKADFK